MTIPKATITKDLTAQVDGLATSFTVAPDAFIPGTLNVELNGQRLRAGAPHDFVETGLSTFTTTLTPRVGEHLLVQYEIEDTGAGFPLVEAYSVEDF